MDLKLTFPRYDKMTDTNKLLYLIYGELVSIREALTPTETRSGIDTQPTQETVPTEQVEAPNTKDGFKCKYCDEIIPGNRGNLLAHIRQCSKRT